MKRLLVLCLALGFLACAVSTANALNLLSNGNVDVTVPTLIVDNAPPGPGPEDFFLAKPAVWENIGTRTITGAYEDEMSSEGFAGNPPTPDTADGTGAPHPLGCGDVDCGVFFKAFTGNAANGPATGHLQQAVPGGPGRTYTMTGWAGAATNFLGGAEFAIDYLNAGNAVIGSTTLNLLPTLAVPNGEPFNYKKYTLSGVSPAGTAFVRARASMIGGTPNPLGGDQAYVVDDFTLVPEPASVMLSLIGVASLGLVRRRR
jgi:hypothetical protein